MLVAVSLASRHYVLPISVAISALLLIVAISYSQGIKAYEGTSGGSYVFARENLGVLPALAGRRRVADRLHPHRRRLGRGGGLRADLRGAVPRRASRAALARLHRRADAGEPARRPRGGPDVRVPDVRLPRGDVRHPRRGRRQVHGRHLPDRERAASASGRSRRDRPLRPAEGVRVRLGGADRRGVDLERRDGVPPPAGEKCCDDPPADGGLGGDALPRGLVPGGEDGRAPERDGVGALAGRARDLPGRLAGLGRLLPRPGVHARDPGARREHVVPGLPAAGGAARPRQLPAPPVREPRRPARLLERDPRPDRRGVGPDRRLRRECELADPPLRDRRLHGVHARRRREWCATGCGRAGPAGAGARS